MIEPLPDGSHRINAIKITTANSQLILINAYMPTLGAAQANYDEVLDEVHEMISKFSECTVIWAGDINAASDRQSPTSNDKKLAKFCKEESIRISPHMPNTPTFHHFNGMSTSRIDLFLQRKDDETIENITILVREPLNTSPHDPVVATIPVFIPSKQQTTKSTREPAPRIKWDKVDKPQYRDLTDTRLEALINNMEDMPACITTSRLNSILTECASKSCPPPPKRKRKTKFRWSSTFKPLAEESCAAHRDLCKARQMKEDDREQVTKLRAAKKILRKAQRQSAAKRRTDIKTAIIEACHKNNKMEFFKLVRKQRSTQPKTYNIDFGDHIADTTPNSWARYYEDLATPKDDPTFDDEYERHLQISYLLQLLTTGKESLPTISEREVSKLIKLLKLGKAPDIFGVSSEHVRLASPKVIKILTHLTNNALTSGKLPDTYKLGSVCPVPKKGKPPKHPANFRRITITSIVGKVVELHMMSHSRPILDPAQSRLQFGFTCGVSPIYAALVLTEVMAEAADSKEPLYITLLDTSKAFDVVNHKAMLNALHQQGVTGQLWRLYDSMYSGIKSVVKWENELSDPFDEGQGIRQGGSSSADKYKSGKNKLLYHLDSDPSNRIGHIATGAAMVADDLAVSSSCVSKLQVSLHVAERDAGQERYKYNTDKTKVIINNTDVAPNLQLNSTTLDISNKEPHLGIIRNNKNNNADTMDNRVKSARRVVFSLLGAGYVGLNGAGPYIAALQYRTYVAPVLLYGLEAIVPNTKDFSALSLFHRNNLRRIQFLPESTAIPALHLLSGIPPVEALIHIRALNLFRSIIAADTPSPPAIYIRELIMRQLAMKGPKSASWTTYIRQLLIRYQLPNLSLLIESIPEKKRWNQMVKVAVNHVWTEKLIEEAKEMSSLCYLKVDECSSDNMHPTWHNLQSPLDIRKATVKAQLLVRRYPLTTCPTAGAKRSDSCPLCKSEPETTPHFLLQCHTLQKQRKPYLTRIMITCRQQGVSVDTEELTKVILDTNHLPVPDRSHEETCRNMIFKLHSERAKLLGGGAKYKGVKNF